MGKRDPVGLFGFNIEAEEAQRLRRLHGADSCADIFDYEEGFLKLPQGFVYTSYGLFECPDGFLVGIKDEHANAILRGEMSPVDMSPLIEWAQKNGVRFKNNIPSIHYDIDEW